MAQAARERDVLAARLRETDAGRDALRAELAAAAAASTEAEAARNAQIAELRTNVTTGAAQIAELERSLSDSTSECIICCDAQATMAFVHGATAHLAACEGCAIRAVQEHHERCPICRAPFERIVTQFRA